jgi:hypothetical protein
MIEHGPFAVMAGAPWNVLDSRGARIACCGGDSNADWERCGPPIAAEIVKALNEHDALVEVMHWAQTTLTALNVGSHSEKGRLSNDNTQKNTDGASW